MGTKEKTVKRIVLDTNVLVSALLFKGDLARIVDSWKSGKIVPVFSRETFEEFKGALKYPKFKLTEVEIKLIIEEEVLPFFDIVEIAGDIKEVCRDPDDDKFIACALSSAADFIVSGDKDLLDMKAHRAIKIISVSDLLRII